MGFGDVGERDPTITIMQDCQSIDIDRPSADVSAFELGAPHAGAHPFYDEIALEFGDGTDNDDHCPAERSAGVDILPERDELDVEVVQLIEDFKEVASRTGDAIERPDQHNIETMLVGIVQEVVEPRPFRLGPTDPVGVLTNDLITTLRSPSLAGRAAGFRDADRGSRPAGTRHSASSALTFLLRFEPVFLDILLDELHQYIRHVRHLTERFLCSMRGETVQGGSVSDACLRCSPAAFEQIPFGRGAGPNFPIPDGLVIRLRSQRTKRAAVPRGECQCAQPDQPRNEAGLSQ